MTSSKDKRLLQQYEANERYECKMEAAGMKKIRVWVPDGEQHRVKTFAAGLRKPGQIGVKR